METETRQASETPVARKPFYRRGWFIVAAIVVAVPVLAVAWYLGSPLFLNQTVVEAFPVATTAAPAAGDAPTSTSAPPTGSAAAPEGTNDSALDEPADGSTPTELDNGDAATETPAPPSGPIALLEGSFEGADRSHQGSGSVTVYELEDGSWVLRFEDLDVTNGPDLHVIVSPVADPQSRDDVAAAGYIDLGSLKGNRGDQNYEIPLDFDLSAAASIVIYCKPFHVIFATAQLSSA